MKKGQIIENMAGFGNNLELMSVQQKHFDIMHLCVMAASHILLTRRYFKRFRKICRSWWGNRLELDEGLCSIRWDVGAGKSFKSIFSWDLYFKNPKPVHKWHFISMYLSDRWSCCLGSKDHLPKSSQQPFPCKMWHGGWSASLSLCNCKAHLG